MEFIVDNSQKSVGVYRCPDEIKNFKIRIKIGEVHKQNGKNPEYWVEKEFSWQEKHFSKTQQEYYRDERNCFTELDNEYHKLICDSKLQDGDNDFLFSYVNEENICPDSEIQDKINYLENAMNNLEIGCSNADNEEYNFMTSLRNSVDNPLFKSNVEKMFLMADIGEYFEDTWIKNEKLLCTIKFNSDLKVLSVFPDFTNSRPYTLKIQNEEERIFSYFIENSSKNIPESIAVNEKTLIKKINDYKTSLKTQIITDTFKLPPKNKLLVFMFLEISCGRNFEYPDVYVQYFIDLPERWFSPNAENLIGRTQICRAVKEDGLVHFGHCVEVILEYNFLPMQDTEFPKSPYIYFEVVSKDSWDRHRTEGLCYKCLPVSSLGTFKYVLNCFRFTSSNPINEMRRFFIGDCQNYDDVTWIGIPKDHDDSVLNKFGTETKNTGELNVTLSIVHQSQSLLDEEDTNGKNRHERIIFERLGSSSLIKSVEQVIREFKKARKQMIEARRS